MSRYYDEWNEEFDRILNSSSPRRSRMDIGREVDEIMEKRKFEEFKKNDGRNYGKYSDTHKAYFHN